MAGSWLWGDNSFGQTTVPASATNVVAIAAGGDHSLALKSDGSVIAWGNNSHKESRVPPTLSGIVAIAAGPALSMAIQGDGKVITWGSPSNLPATVSNAVMVAGGLSSGLALGSGGNLVGWGVNAPFLAILKFPASATNLVALSAGAAHCLALKGDGIPRILGPIRYGTLQSLVSLGAGLPLAVRAVGSPPLHYQWLVDGVPVPGNDTAYPLIPPPADNVLVNYQVIVTNALGSATPTFRQVSTDAPFMPGVTASTDSALFLIWSRIQWA